MKTVAYLRISTGSQDLANQKLAVLDYARQKRFAIDRFVEAQASSRKGRDQRRIEELLGTLAAGDRLVVSELSRLGRSLGQVIQIVDELVKRKVRFIAIKEAIRFEGKQDMQTKVMIALFGLFAEVERDLISERTKEGLGGRPGQGPLARPPQGLAGQVQARRQGGGDPDAPGEGGLQGVDRQDRGRIADQPPSLHPDPKARPEGLERVQEPGRPPSLEHIFAAIWAVPLPQNSPRKRRTIWVSGGSTMIGCIRCRNAIALDPDLPAIDEGATEYALLPFLDSIPGPPSGEAPASICGPCFEAIDVEFSAPPRGPVGTLAESVRRYLAASLEVHRQGLDPDIREVFPRLPGESLCEKLGVELGAALTAVGRPVCYTDARWREVYVEQGEGPFIVVQSDPYTGGTTWFGCGHVEVAGLPGLVNSYLLDPSGAALGLNPHGR